MKRQARRWEDQRRSIPEGAMVFTRRGTRGACIAPKPPCMWSQYGGEAAVIASLRSDSEFHCAPSVILRCQCGKFHRVAPESLRKLAMTDSKRHVRNARSESSAKFQPAP